MVEHLIAFMKKRCWERREVRRLLAQLELDEGRAADLLRILDEVAAYCLGETDELPVLLPASPR
jgi:hypothetical protein